VRLDAALDQMERARTHERLAQAYVVKAPPRSIGRSFADALIASLMCEAEVRPCGTCRGCRQLAQGSHPDVHEVEPTLRSRQIDVDAIRRLQKPVYQTAYFHGWKVGVIRSADRMTLNAANAFLKTLEEPPPKTLFLLLTDKPYDMLPTITSRCQSLSLDEEAQALGKWQSLLLEIVESDVGGGASRSAGPLTLGIAKSDRIMALMKLVRAEIEDEVKEETQHEDITEEACKARVSSRYRESRADLMLAMLLWYRDCLVLAVGGDRTLLAYREREAMQRSYADMLGERGLLNCVATVEGMQDRMEKNLPENVVLSYGLSRIGLLEDVAARKHS